MEAGHNERQETGMKRSLSLIAAGFAAGLALAVTPVAAMASQGTVHYGPFRSFSTDSGTCGNDWANDTFKRVFEASTTRNADGTYSVTESFIEGRFVTKAGKSPGACNKPAAPTGGTIRAGVMGSFHGSFQVVIAGGTFNPNASCNQATCDTTKKFVKTVYGSAATYTTGPSFAFTYHAQGNDLLQRMWHNASADRGGNFGDIRSS
jgi:hypothetical protein